MLVRSDDKNITILLLTFLFRFAFFPLQIENKSEKKRQSVIEMLKK